MTYKETLDTLYNMMPDFQNVGADAYKPGLERVTEFNRLLGNPDRAFCSIHVAGTNGKGSVSHMLAAALQSAGYRTGLYTSPHLRDFRERIKVDGEMIPEETVSEFANLHMERMRSIGLSFFEATMCMAFRHFADSDVEVAVVETGLGGRLDSTNIIEPLASVITNIGMDHQTFLGDTIEKIAAEKAGIIKSGVPVIVGESDDRSSGVFRRKAAETGSPLLFADSCFKCTGAAKKERSQVFTFERAECGTRFDLETDLLGDYQSRNIATVLAVVEVLNRQTPITLSSRAVRSGVASAALMTGLRGRWEIIGYHPLVVCDTGHNSHGLKLVAQQIKDEHYAHLFMVIGMVGDKDFSEILPLLPREAYYIFTAPSVARALPAVELAGKGAEYGLSGEVVGNARDALARARELAGADDMIFVGGSSFTVADII